MNYPIIYNVKVLPKGQITIPKDIRKLLNIKVGDRLSLVYEKDHIILMNSALFALKEFQKAMIGEAEKAGLHSDDDIVKSIKQMRCGDEA